MGNFPASAGPNDVVLLQYGNGQGCDCGPRRFEPSHAENDNRLLARGLTPAEVRVKITRLNSAMLKYRSPHFFILLPLCFGMIIMIVIQLTPVFRRGVKDRMLSSSLICPSGQPRTTKKDKLIWPDIHGDKRSCGAADEYYRDYCNERENVGCYNHLVKMCCGQDNVCEGRRVCNLGEVHDPYGNNCCNFFCCTSSEDDAGARTEPWDMKGPYLEDTGSHNSEGNSVGYHCPRMQPSDRIFHLTADAPLKLRAEPWFNESLNLSSYVQGVTWMGKQLGPVMNLGCNCDARHDSRPPNGPFENEWYAVCDKMIVTGRFRSERHMTEEDLDHDEFFFLDILRYMGGLIVILFIIPGICCLARQRKRMQEMVTEFFADWVQRGIITRVSYFPGAKHSQARLTLHLPYTYMNSAMMTNPNSGTGAGVQMVMVQQPGAHMNQPYLGGALGGSVAHVVPQPGPHAQPMPVARSVVVSTMPIQQPNVVGNQVMPMVAPIDK